MQRLGWLVLASFFQVISHNVLGAIAIDPNILVWREKIIYGELFSMNTVASKRRHAVIEVAESVSLASN